MIASIQGTILRVEASGLVLGVGGIGVRVFTPRNVLENTGGIGRYDPLAHAPDRARDGAGPLRL